MKILLDENLPRKLVDALRNEGHEVESIQTLRMQGLDNGRLYRFAVENFRVTLPQKPQDLFVADFLAAFRATDLNRFQHGDDWP